MDSFGFGIGVMLFLAVVVGLLAKRKNRNPIGWGIAGGLFFLIALLILAFLPYLCPKCKQKISTTDAKAGNCSKCKSASELKIDITSINKLPEEYTPSLLKK